VDPDVVVLTGGVVEAGDILLNEVRLLASLVVGCLIT
jgi:hypothetical protein